MLEKIRRKLKKWILKESDFGYDKPMDSSDEFNDIYLFDFKNYSSMYTGTGVNNSFILVDEPDNTSEPEDGLTNKRPMKIKVKPKDVLCELETIPTPFNLMLLEEKISILKDKERLINQSYAKREISALIDRLENRKKYNEYRSFFDNFQNTTDEKIDNLLSKYKLVMKTSDIFIPEFPDDAIAVMTDYTDNMMKLCGKKPIFYVIAEEKDFKKAYEKRDPILLVQSPFGFYWQILGAWDEEMLILSEL